MSEHADLSPLLSRIADALERLSPPAPATADFDAAEAFVWHPVPGAFRGSFQAIAKVNRVPLAMLIGIDRTIATLHDNTKRFAAGLPANNALLWGARGMGKSSLVKAVHGSLVGAGDSPSPQGDSQVVASSRPEAPERASTQPTARYFWRD